MVENRARESAKIIPETEYFLSEMISDLIDSPPTSPSDTMSNSKLKDCLKAAQSDNKEAKISKQKRELSCKTKDKSSKSGDKGQARKRDRRKPGREKFFESSKGKSTEVGAGEQSPVRLDKSKKNMKEKRRYEETIIDNIVISAFKSWEDLQDEVNERISAHRVQDNQCNQTPIPQSDFNQQGSSAQASPQLQDSQPEINRLSYDTLGRKLELEDNITTQQNSVLETHLTIKSTLPLSFTEQIHDRKTKRHRERDRACVSGPTPSSERRPQDTLGIASKVESPRVTNWVPGRELSGKGLPDGERVSSDITRSIGLHQSSQQFTGQNGHRFNPPHDVARREFEAHFNRAKHQQLFGPPPLPPYDFGHPPSNVFHQNSSAPTGPQMSSANQYLQNYFGPHPYNQHMRDSNPYGLPAPSQPLFSQHTPFPAPSSLPGPYTSPYTITDTIISRQTIIPPSMSAGRFGHLPSTLSAIEHGPASMMKYPSYVPSPTERSFMEFARSYANANSISGFMNQPMNPGLNPTGSTFNPSFERFLAEQRAMANPSAHSSLHMNDSTSRFGMPNYHNEARSAINPPASFYPHLFR